MLTEFRTPRVVRYKTHAHVNNHLDVRNYAKTLSAPDDKVTASFRPRGPDRLSSDPPDRGIRGKSVRSVLGLQSDGNARVRIARFDIFSSGGFSVFVVRTRSSDGDFRYLKHSSTPVPVNGIRRSHRVVWT